jgi:hypothetical protein
MGKSGMGSANEFSAQVTAYIDAALSDFAGNSVRKKAAFTAGAMSHTYLQERISGKRLPFNTNDIQVIAQLIGLTPFELVRNARTGYVPLRSADVVGIRDHVLTEDEAYAEDAAAKSKVTEIDEFD